jgi:hypothetical protein
MRAEESKYIHQLLQRKYRNFKYVYLSTQCTDYYPKVLGLVDYLVRNLESRST